MFDNKMATHLSLAEMLLANAKTSSVVSVAMAVGKERSEEKNMGLSQLIMSSSTTLLLVFLNRRDFYFLNSKFASECSEKNHAVYLLLYKLWK